MTIYMAGTTENTLEIVCMPGGIVSARRPKQGIAGIYNAGFKNMVLDMALYYPPEEFRKEGNGGFGHPAETDTMVKEMLDQCREKDIHIKLVYAPYLPRDIENADLNGLLALLAKESMKACRQTGCKYMVARPLFAGIQDTDLWDYNREYYLELAQAAKESDVQILLENQCRDRNGHLVRGVCADMYDAASWIDALNEAEGEDRFGFCMDVGACTLCGQNMYDFVLKLGKRLKAVILRDCDGSRENALVPFTSSNRGQPQTDGLGLVRGLREEGFTGQIILNMKDTMEAVPLSLRPEIMKLAGKIADYFKWQIGMENMLKKYPSRVLFGAGNMCRNYMKCYGEKYPPLYTCDNDKSRWNTCFCGLEVKNPQQLKELPENCAIFICNIYYEEIYLQLRNMGIENPIEYFNDENMPSFYFDRLEMKH